MEIRFAQPGDLPGILRLEQENFIPEEQISEPVLAAYAANSSQSSLVMIHEGEVVAYLLACPAEEKLVTDAIFELTNSADLKGRYLHIASLSVDNAYQGQGLGTLLTAALKEVARSRDMEGIALTCKEYLLNYYERNGFEDMGLSQSQFGGGQWFDMYWSVP
ncbi:GNAT family N-acetyltransferase [Streptococcus suis]